LACKAYLGLPERKFSIERFDNYLEQEVVYKYRTPIRFIEIRISDKKKELKVTIKVNYGINSVLAQEGIWPTVSYKIPDLVRGHLLDIINSGGIFQRV
jgi:hypothetical protein